MKLFTGLFLLVAAFALVGCEKKVETPVVVDAAVVEAVDAGTAANPACCEADAAAPVAPLTAAPATAAPIVNNTAAVTPTVAVPTTTIKK